MKNFLVPVSLPSISPQKIIPGFLDDALERNFPLNHNY